MYTQYAEPSRRLAGEQWEHSTANGTEVSLRRTEEQVKIRQKHGESMNDLVAPFLLDETKHQLLLILSVMSDNGV